MTREQWKKEYQFFRKLWRTRIMDQCPTERALVNDKTLAANQVMVNKCRRPEKETWTRDNQRVLLALPYGGETFQEAFKTSKRKGYTLECIIRMNSLMKD